MAGAFTALLRAGDPTLRPFTTSRYAQDVVFMHVSLDAFLANMHIHVYCFLLFASTDVR
jgi:hypothetical protein